MTTRDELKILHLTTCRADRERLLVQLASYQAGASMHTGGGKSGADMTPDIKARLETEIEQLSTLIKAEDSGPKHAARRVGDQLGLVSYRRWRRATEKLRFRETAPGDHPCRDARPPFCGTSSGGSRI